MKKNYSSEVMDLKLDALSKRICDNHKEAKDRGEQIITLIQATKTQVEFTNGKVKKITIALVFLGAFSLGLGLKQMEFLVQLFT